MIFSIILILTSLSLHASNISPELIKYEKMSGRDYYDQLVGDITKSKKGRVYYDSLIDKATEKCWITPISVHYTIADRSYDGNHNQNTLANLVFGNEFAIKDIFLFSKLSDDNKVHLPPPRDAQDLEARFERGNVAIGGNRPLGAFRDDLFTTLLAPAPINIESEMHEFVLNISWIYHFFIGDSKKTVGSVGVTFPFKSRQHIMTLQFSGIETFARTSSEEQRKQIIEKFNNEFIDLEDFFLRAVLEPKRLIFQRRQRSTGLSDVSFFGLIDCAGQFNHVDGLQIGINLIVPAGGKKDGTKVWEIVRGNGGAFQGEFFVHALFNSSSRAFNPLVRVIGQVSAPFTSRERVPKIKKLTAQAQIPIPDLIVPIQTFQGFFVEPFEEADTTVLHFADQAVAARRKLGSRILVGVGNYFYNVFKRNFRLGILYQYMHKSKDSVTVKRTEDIFDTTLLETKTNQKMHTIGWDLSYKFNNMVELNVGSEHAVAGKNVPKHHEVFASIVAVF